MRAPSFLSALREDRSTADARPQAARPRGLASGARVTGAAFPLAGLAIAAAATIAVFFGIGLAGLLEPSPALVHPAPPSAAAPGKPPQPEAPRRALPPPQASARAAPSARVAPLAGPAATPTPANPAAVASPPAAEQQSSAPATSSPAAPAPVLSPQAAPPQLPSSQAAPPSSAASPQAAPPPAAPPPAAPSPSSPAPAASVPAKPGPAPAANGPAAGQTLPPAEITALLAAGDAAFRRGDLAAARLSYRRVYDAGEGRGALGMGASYDPLFLQHFHLARAHPDPAEARTWYLRAKALGAAEATGRLDRLVVKPSP